MTFGGDWDKFANAMGPAFERNLGDAAVGELNRVGRIAGRVARRMIRSKAYAKNAPKTIALKRNSTTPLVNHGDLLGSIRHQVMRWETEINHDLVLILGANKKDPSGQNIAKKLSDGVPSKRGPGWFIPPRPFLSRPTRDPEVTKALQTAAWKSVRAAVKKGKAG